MPGRVTNTPTVVTNPSTPSSYTVKSGDTLSGIARQLGTTVQALVDANKGRYPTLATNPGAIEVGWTFSVSGRSNNVPTPQVNEPRSNNDILMVGMNHHGKDEAAALRRRGNNVTFIGDSFQNDKIQVKDARGQTKTYDLTHEAGINEFAMSLGLSGEQTQKVADVLNRAGGDARDELAMLAREFAKAEKGGTIPSRLVLSGHNVGSGIWGDDNGKMSWDLLGQLTEAMPRAARQIEDVHLSACYSGGLPAMERYRGMFPNAKTIWAYTGSAPGSWSGAMTHQARWDTATRGTREELNRSLADGSRKGENVAVWSSRLGYMDGKEPELLSSVRGDFDGRADTYTRFFAGDETQASTQSGPLREYYNSLQRLLQHPELPAGERPDLESRRDQTIRLIYYSATVAPKFQQCYGDQINEGFRAVGMEPPNFSTMSRKDAMAQIAAFERKIAESNPPPELATRLLPLLTEGLRDLNPARIPDGWV